MEAHFLTLELFRLFLAEDDDDLRGDLRWLIERRLPGTVVDAVSCIEEGLEHLRNGSRPLLAVLDIRLPARPRMHATADLRLADRLRELGVASLCITGYSGSEDVSEYLKQRSLFDPPLAVIQKRVGPDYVDELIGEIRKWFVRQSSRRIDATLNRVFGGSADSTGQHSGTAALMSLQQDILNYWGYLDPATREQVARRFDVEEVDGRITQLALRLGH